MVVGLSPRDVETLSRFAHEMGISRPVALRRIVKKHLAEYRRLFVSADPTPENQLDIFDSVQIDIFNNTSKTI
mgnify:CR=1 FL=1